MKILIVYGTTEGQTRKVARFIGDVFQKDGHQVTLADASDHPPGPELFDAILVGASIHMHKYQSSVSHYVRRAVTELNKKPSSFFSVCLAVASTLEEEHLEADKIRDNFLKDTGWRPLAVTHVAGALKYTEYDFFKRLIMKMIAKREGRSTDTSQDYEYTDWNAVEKFAGEFEKKMIQLAGITGRSRAMEAGNK